MIPIIVMKSRWGYALRPAILSSAIGGSPLLKILDIAERCNLHPDKMVFNVNIPHGIKRSDCENFCILAQLEDLHITIEDFDNVRLVS